MELLTEIEVATFLRRSRSSVKRLRQLGLLPFIAGRPPMILRSDLEAYLEAEKQKAAANVSPRRKGKETPVQPKTFADMTPGERAASAREWVLAQKVKPARAKRAV